MFKNFLKALVISFLCFWILACVTHRGIINPAFERGRYAFEAGFYKTAMRQLMPVAISGHPQAEYAVGYMYYYGYGAPQDPEMGLFWIQKSADQGFPPAIAALNVVMTNDQCQPSTPCDKKVVVKKKKCIGEG